jgi:hypothetical protein
MSDGFRYCMWRKAVKQKLSHGFSVLYVNNYASHVW